MKFSFTPDCNLRRAVLSWLLALGVAAPANAGDHAQTRSLAHRHNEQFQQHNLDVEAWLERFENPTRDVIRSRDAVVAAMDLQPGQTVVDIGAGTGAYMEPIVQVIGTEGRYFGVDISPGFLSFMSERALGAGFDNVTLVLSRPDSATLPPGTADVILTVNTYHHFESVGPMLESIVHALKPGGRLIVVDFDRNEDTSRAWIMEHIRASKSEFRREIEASGLRFIEERSDLGLEENFFFRFIRPGAEN